MSSTILRTAREHYDIRTASDANISYDNRYSSPKIFAQQFANPTSSPYYTDYSHNLGYVPSAYLMRKLTSTTWCHGMVDDQILLPYEYAFYDSLVELDTSKARIRRVRNTNTSSNVDQGTMAILYLDPVVDDDVDKYNDPYDRPRLSLAKESKDVRVDHPKDFSIDTRFQSFKIFRTGTLTLNAPSVTTGGAGVVDTRSTYYTHGLGYIPFYTPLVPYQSELHFVYFDRGGYTIPTTINVSELSDFSLGNILATGPTMSERINIYIDSTKLHLVFKREGYYSGETFPARTINLKYTIFYNRVDREFDLLN